MCFVFFSCARVHFAHMTRQSCSHRSVWEQKQRPAMLWMWLKVLFYCSNKGCKQKHRSLPVCVKWEVSVCGCEAQTCGGNSECEGHLCGDSSEVNSKGWELPLRLTVVGDIEVHAAACSLAFICCLFPATGPRHPTPPPVRAFVINHPTFLPSLNDFAPYEKISHLWAVPALLLLHLLYPTCRSPSAHSKL